MRTTTVSRLSRPVEDCFCSEPSVMLCEAGQVFAGHLASDQSVVWGLAEYLT